MDQETRTQHESLREMYTRIGFLFTAILLMKKLLSKLYTWLTQKSSHLLSGLGWLLTTAWLAIIWKILEHQGNGSIGDGLNHLITQPLNNQGDFLAGAAIPLALLWLLIGYFLQRKELELQRLEIKRQAGLKREEIGLYEAARIAALQPAFSIREEDTDTNNIIFSCENYGARVSGLTIDLTLVYGEELDNANYFIDITPSEHFMRAQRNGTITFWREARKGVEFNRGLPERFIFRILYTDQMGNLWEVICHYHPKMSGPIVYVYNPYPLTGKALQRELVSYNLLDNNVVAMCDDRKILRE